MDGVWRSSIHHMPIPNAIPIYLNQYHPSLLRRSECHVLSVAMCCLSNHWTLVKRIPVPVELDIGQFIVAFDDSTFKLLELFVICYLFTIFLSVSIKSSVIVPSKKHHCGVSQTWFSGHNWDHKFILLIISSPPPLPTPLYSWVFLLITNSFPQSVRRAPGYLVSDGRFSVFVVAWALSPWCHAATVTKENCH